MAQAPYYHATLCLHGSLIVSKSEHPEGVKVVVGLSDIQVPVGVKRRLAALLQDKPPEGEQGIIVWPRTDKEGLLGNGTQLALYKSAGELDRKPGLHALGELVKVDKENALLHIQIHPNEGQGSLQKPFRLPLVATLELLEGLPELGSGLEVWGELKPRTGRLVVTKARAVPLPPKRAAAAPTAG
jgi:hypothetical protein